MNKSRLSDIADIIMGQSPKGDTCNFDGIGKPLLNGPTEFGDFYPTAKQYTTNGKKLSIRGDILFCVRGSTTGRMNWADKEYVLGRGLASIRHKKGEKLNHFLKYLIDINLSSILKATSGSTFPNLTSDILNSFKVAIPDDNQAEKINDFLKKLDAKIELNNKINRELEAMAKTLYDYWFVQFDFPNEQGKPYKSSGGKMVFNEELKREIPEGWEVIELGDVVERTGTGLNPRKNFVLGEGNNYYVTIKNIQQGRIILDDKCDKISDKSLDIINRRSDLQIGDILFTSIEPVGITYLIKNKPKNWNINESVFTVRPKYSKVTSEFLYMFLSGDYIKSYTKNVSAGSIHKGIRHSTLKECKFILPECLIIKKYTNIIKPILNKIDLIQQENQQLTALRDWLLPMLMNGQITVKEAEEQLSMAAEPQAEYKKG